MNSITKQSIRLWPQASNQVSCFSTTAARHQTDGEALPIDTKPATKTVSSRIIEFRKRLRATTPMDKLDQTSASPFQEQEPLKPWPNNTNPHTGEIGGPAGPEPTRYGDWERKGRVSDF